jgi:hypothetical protein
MTNTMPALSSSRMKERRIVVWLNAKGGEIKADLAIMVADKVDMDVDAFEDLGEQRRPSFNKTL